MKSIFPVIAAIALLGAAACNTVEGVGQDVSSAGNAVSEAADDARD